MSSALAMILTAAMAVPGNGPEKVSGEIEDGLNLGGKWEGILYHRMGAAVSQDPEEELQSWFHASQVARQEIAQVGLCEQDIVLVIVFIIQREVGTAGITSAVPPCSQVLFPLAEQVQKGSVGVSLRPPRSHEGQRPVAGPVVLPHHVGYGDQAAAAFPGCAVDIGHFSGTSAGGDEVDLLL
jgi:hypothetical protein